MQSHWARTPTWWLSFFFTLTILLGLVFLKDYGESWDEYNFFEYGREALSAYESLFTGRPAQAYSDPTLRHYGAWFWVLCVLASRLFPEQYISDVAHGLTFLTFQAGVLGLYLLARRWLKPWSAFLVTLLFATQPLLWGHAFINERDVASLSTFIWALYWGLCWKDALAPFFSPQPARRGLTSQARADWYSLRPSIRLALPVLWVLGGIGLGWGTSRIVQRWLARAPALADPAFIRDFDLYLRPVLARFWGGMLFLLLWLLWMAGTALPFLPRLRAAMWSMEGRPRAQQAARLGRSPLFWAASASLGLTAGVRVVGWLAGGLIAWLIWRQYRQRALWPLTLYALTGFAVMYVSWPYLWGEPLLRLLITLRLMLNFSWPGKVLFQGHYYVGNEVPPSYLPTLMALQLTEPVVLLAVLGLPVLVWKVWRQKSHVELGEVVLLWFGLPLLALTLGNSYRYDNFRQFLFLLPPVFLLAGLTLEVLRARLGQAAWGILAGLLLLPGIVAIFSLHPYPYIYYNSLTGGVRGAFRRYEMDYWGTSFRAAAAYLNRYAPPGAAVVVWGPPTTFWRYARPDIRVYNALEESKPERDFYALISTRYDADLTVYPDLPVLFQVEKAGASLAVVRYVPP